MTIVRAVAICVVICIVVAGISWVLPEEVSACSTFMLKKGGEVIYGHNLNEGDIGVPGMVFINKRGTFKEGRTMMELFTKETTDRSTLSWISRYGSVTFNNFGQDLPDGGFNEAGLYIWEMNEDADYPQNDSLPKVMHANWMQFVLDNYSTLDEAIHSTGEVMLDGWTWHYFLGDRDGNCATLAFINGEVVVNRGETMPVPGLFNTPYDREMELLPYFQGFGGSYEPAIGDSEVPRFVKTAVMVRDYDPVRDAVEYGFEMLDNLRVWDDPEWSILVDARRMEIYFKTRVNPTVKRFSMHDIDFSNDGPVLILNMDFETDGKTDKINTPGRDIAEDVGIGKGIDITDMLHPVTDEEVQSLIRSLTEIPEIPTEFFTHGGFTVDEFVSSLSEHNKRATEKERQYFAGAWKTAPPESSDDTYLELDLRTDGVAVTGTISNSEDNADRIAIEHIHMIGNNLVFTYRAKKEKRIMEARAWLEGDSMRLRVLGTEWDYGEFTLHREG